MNKEETWALFKQGKDAWNAWADRMLAKRKALEEAGEWRIDWRGVGENEKTKIWLEAAKADFDKRIFAAEEFPGGIEFGGFIFPGRALFERAKFRETARFRGASFGGAGEFERAKFERGARFFAARFQGTVVFRMAEFGEGTEFERARFERNAWFFHATFEGKASFAKATFERDAGFYNTTFGGEVDFLLATFQSYTNFERARFVRSSDFNAIEVKRTFTLAGATFLQVPSFIQANFTQAPRLDELVVPSSASATNFIEQLLERDKSLEARWRSLKRLAEEAKDQSREQEFFKGELKARRWSIDWPWHPVFWFALAYEVLSGFGRSFLRPVFWLLVVIAVFFCLYLEAHPTLADRNESGFDWVWVHAASVYENKSIESIEQVVCEVPVSGSDAVTAAFSLSVRNTLPFAGLGGPEKLNQVYRCLYGVEGTKSAGFPETRMTPRIPDRVAFYGMAQTLISAVLIFLFLLALRNHFRIK